MDKICKNCGHTNLKEAVLCVSCGSNIEKEEPKFYKWLNNIYPLFLGLASYAININAFRADWDYNLGLIFGAVITLPLIPAIVLLIRKLLKKKKLTEKGKVFLFYGVGIFIWIFYWLGQLANNASQHLVK